jgi:hypothetical protein
MLSLHREKPLRKHGNIKGGGNKGANGDQNPPNPNRCIYKPPTGIHSVRIEPTTEDHDRDAEQKTYQTRQIGLSRGLNIITSVAAALSFCALLLLYRSTDAATKQAKTAQNEFVSSQRPWVSLEVIDTGQLILNYNRMAIDGVAYSINNVGHSVATNVIFKPIIEPFANETFRECEVSESSKKTIKAVQFGNALFPSQTFHGTWPTAGFTYGEHSNSGLKLIACISYTSSIDNATHFTRVGYWITDKTSPQDLLLPNSGAHTIQLVMDINGTKAN